MFYVHQNCLFINHTNSYAFSQHFLRILPQFLDVFLDFIDFFRPLKHVEIDILEFRESWNPPIFSGKNHRKPYLILIKPLKTIEKP
jgi:hypothetical protein